MSFIDLGIPASSSTVSVKVFNVVDEPNTVIVPAAVFLSPVLPGRENLGFPVFAFLIENAATKQRIMFDLGPRKDLENAAPVIAEAVKAGVVSMPVSRDIGEQLQDAGVDLQSISAVIWSHAHFDHIGDMSKFPSSTVLVFGQEMGTNSSDPKIQLVDNDMAYVSQNSVLLLIFRSGRKLVPLDFANSELEFGGFKSHDFFGDGSFYLLDVPGHLDGHICALARVTPTSFVFLAGDACFHPGLLRPTAELHQHFPCPEELLTTTRRSISAAHFPSDPSPDSSDEFDLATRTMPLLDIAETGYFQDPPLARGAIQKIRTFDINPDVLVVIGHDESLMSVVGSLPATLDGWKSKGWKERLIWAFLEEKNPAFRFNVKMVA
ncbi:beta-lactamase-like protein [Mycena pura]|uniref:Beta-lactamase-like protein n=1 Tax=Mycena pura TaxID=153505 RepID=A0AAD6YCH4_9AGAR|nr:beta-lactamase-like protein [Mycena pura]KAJ7209000.1 beta-lactamase-like protein [Mycena pura]